MRSLIILLLASSPLHATEWSVLGARAVGMGGAGVALPNGPLGAYWNPASLASEESKSGVQIPVGVGWNITGTLIEGANDLNSIAEDCRVGPTFGTCSQANIQTAVNKINATDSGMRAEVNGAIDTKIKKVTVFVNHFTQMAARGRADTTNVTPATVNNNIAKLIARGIGVTEIGAGYGMPIGSETGLSVGGNLKAIVGQTAYDEVTIVSDDAVFGDLDTNTKQTVQPGVDVGVLWDVQKAIEKAPARPRLGLTVRNINRPGFKNPDVARAAGQGEKTYLDPQARVGLAFTPLSFLNVAADVDVTRNLTELAGMPSQQLSVGAEVNVLNGDWFNIPLRAGLSRNIAYSGSKTEMSGGVGLHFGAFKADLSVRISPARVRVESTDKSQDAPASGIAALQLALLFGGAKAD